MARTCWTNWVGCTHVVSAADPAAATILPNPRFRALTEPSESTTHRLLSSETYRTREGTNLLPNGSVASTRSAVATPSLTAVVSCVAKARELTSTGLATAGTVSVVLCRSTVACTVRLCASAARVPSTHTALTSPRESVFAGAPSTRAFVPASVHDTAAAGTGRPSPSTTWKVIAAGRGRPGAPTRTESSGASRRSTSVPAGPTGSPRHPMRHNKVVARLGQRRARMVSGSSADSWVTYVNPRDHRRPSIRAKAT